MERNIVLNLIIFRSKAKVLRERMCGDYGRDVPLTSSIEMADN